MSKFRIRMKLTGLELEIEGSREEAPQIARNLGRQLSGLLGPSAAIVGGEVFPETPPTGGHANGAGTPAAGAAPTPPALSDAGGGRKRGSKRKRSTAMAPAGSPAGSGAGAAPADLAIDFAHDATAWGRPRQEWNTAQKAIWLLYVVSEQGGPRELTAQQIAAIFSRRFRESGQIIVQNVARDLGKQRAKGKDAPVAADATMNPNPWFLTEAGRREAQALVAQARVASDAAGNTAARGEGDDPGLLDG